MNKIVIAIVLLMMATVYATMPVEYDFTPQNKCCAGVNDHSESCVNSKESEIVRLKARIKFLEKKLEVIEKLDDSRPFDSMPMSEADRRANMRDLKGKINEIIDWVNSEVVK